MWLRHFAECHRRRTSGRDPADVRRAPIHIVVTPIIVTQIEDVLAGEIRLYRVAAGCVAPGPLASLSCPRCREYRADLRNQAPQQDTQVPQQPSTHATSDRVPPAS